jgi:hypothetical protein
MATAGAADFEALVSLVVTGQGGVEAAGAVASMAAALLEALSTATRAQAANAEALQGLAVGITMNLEMLLALVRSGQLNTEGLRGIAELGTSDLEALRRMAIEGTVGTEALRVLTAAESVDIEALEVLAAAWPADTEVLSTTAALSTVHAEGLQGLAQTVAAGIEALLAVRVLAAVLNLEALQKTERPAGAGVEALGSTVRQARAVLESLLAVTRQSVASVEVTGTIIAAAAAARLEVLHGLAWQTTELLEVIGRARAASPAGVESLEVVARSAVAALEWAWGRFINWLTLQGFRRVHYPDFIWRPDLPGVVWRYHDLGDYQAVINLGAYTGTDPVPWGVAGPFVSLPEFIDELGLPPVLYVSGGFNRYIVNLAYAPQPRRVLTRVEVEALVYIPQPYFVDSPDLPAVGWSANEHPVLNLYPYGGITEWTA